MKTPAELLKSYLDNVRDPDVIASLFAEDGILELPYLATLGIPPSHQGPAQITAFLKSVISTVKDFRFHDLQIFMETPDQVFAEYKITTTVIASGNDFHQHYMGRLVAENGKIKLLRESLDTAQTIKSFDIKGTVSGF
jgi:ketosteroid isomerase-like protein